MNLKEIMNQFPGPFALAGVCFLFATAFIGVPKLGQLAWVDDTEQRVNSESVERMEFQLEYKLSELRKYEAIPEDERTAADRVQIQELNKQINYLQNELQRLRGY